MGLRMNLTTANLEFDGWDIDVMIGACNDRLDDILDSWERYDEREREISDIQAVFDWWWHLVCNLRTGKASIENSIASRQKVFPDLPEPEVVIPGTGR